MSIHRSLRTGGGLSKHRNVLSRFERIALLEAEGKWTEDANAVNGLPKVRNLKLKTKKKAKKEEGAEGEAAAGAAPGAGAAPAAAAPAAGAAAKGAGAKGAAPKK